MNPIFGREGRQDGWAESGGREGKREEGRKEREGQVDREHFSCAVYIHCIMLLGVSALETDKSWREGGNEGVSKRAKKGGRKEGRE